MRIAVPAVEASHKAAVSDRFGRAPVFFIYDTGQRLGFWLENGPTRDAVQGAGIEAVQALVNQNVQVLLSPRCGPKATHALKEAGIIVHIGSQSSVDEAIHAFLGQAETTS